MELLAEYKNMLIKILNVRFAWRSKSSSISKISEGAQRFQEYKTCQTEYLFGEYAGKYSVKRNNFNVI
jgi:hypothetical protein